MAVVGLKWISCGLFADCGVVGWAAGLSPHARVTPTSVAASALK